MWPEAGRARLEISPSTHTWAKTSSKSSRARPLSWLTVRTSRSRFRRWKGSLSMAGMISVGEGTRQNLAGRAAVIDVAPYHLHLSLGPAAKVHAAVHLRTTQATAVFTATGATKRLRQRAADFAVPSSA